MPVVVCLSRSRSSRITPIKSSEDIELERIEREKKDMQSLRKMNDECLKTISTSSKKEKKPPSAPPSLPSGKSHAMPTRGDTQQVDLASFLLSLSLCKTLTIIIFSLDQYGTMFTSGLGCDLYTAAAT